MQTESLHSHTSDPTQSSLQRLGVRFAAAVAASIGGTWLLLWTLGYPQEWVSSSAITVKSNMAMSQVLAACGLLLLARKDVSKWRCWAGAAIGLLIVLVGALTFSEHLFQYDAGIDQILFTEPPGAAGVISPNRMGPPGSISLTLIGLALLALAFGRRAVAPYLGIAVGLINLVPTIGYIYGANSFYGQPRVTTIAWSAIPAIMALAFGLVLTTNTGPMAMLQRRDPGGTLLRDLLPSTIVLPIVIGYLRTLGQEAGLYDTETGRALLVLSVVLVFSGLLWISAVRLSKSAATEKVAVDSLRAGEAKFRAVFEGAAVGIGRVSFSDACWIDANDALCSMVGYTREEMRVTPWPKITHPADVDLDLIPFRRMMAGELATYTVEKRFIHKRGHLVWARLTLSLVRDGEGRPDYEIAIVENISSQKQAEEALRQSETRFQLAARATKDAIWDWDLATDGLTWTDGIQRAFGYAESQLRPQITWWYEHVHPEDRDEAVESIRSVINSGQKYWSREYRFLKADGTYAKVADRAYVQRESSGTPVRMVGAMQDVTEQRRAEEALREAEERFRLFMDNSPALAWIKDEDGRHVYLNGPYEQHLGVRAENCIGRTDAELWPAEVAKRFRENDLMVLAAGRPVELDEESVTPDGTRAWFRNTKFPFRDGDGNRFVAGIGFDVTKQRRMEEILRQTTERFSKAFSASPDALIISDKANGSILEANDSFVKLMSLRHEETIGHTSLELGLFANPADRARAITILNEHGRVRDFEVSIRTRSGEIRSTLLSVESIDMGGQQCLLTILRDITEQKRAEQELRHSAELLDFGDALLELDRSWRIVRVNARQEELSQKPRSETIGRVFWEVWPETAAPDSMYWREYHRCMEERVTVQFDEYYAPLDLWTGVAAYPTDTGMAVFLRDVGDRKRAEKALREAHDKYQSVLSSISDGFAVLDEDWRFTYFNEQGARMLNMPREELIGGCVWDLFPEAKDRKFFHEYHRAVETGVPVHFDDYYPEPLNMWIESHAYPSGEGLSVYFRDVTERVCIQEALRRSEAMLNTALDHLGEGVIIATADGDVFYWNPAALQMHGFSSLEAARAPFESYASDFEVLTMDGRALRLEEWPIARLMRGEALRNVELRVRRHAQGWERIVSYSGTMVNTAAGERLVFITVYDLTEQRRAERALRKSEARFRALVENIPQMIWVVDNRGIPSYLSAKWLDYTGTSYEQYGEGQWLDLIHPDDRLRSFELWNAAVQSQAEYVTEYRLRRFDGEYRWHLARAVPLLDPNTNEHLWFGTATDIQDQKRAQEALIRSEKLASVGRMAATVAHEINNPLELVMNSVYLASLDPNLSELSLRSLATAEQELERVAHLTRQTLGFYRENSAPTRVEATSLVEDVVQMYAPKMTQRKITLTSEHNGTLHIDAVAGEIRQVVSNIVANAIDASGPGSEVRVRTSSVCLNGVRKVRITLADTGEGIRPEHLPHIFEPFFTTKESVGTGLGLWVSSEIIQRHGGKLRVRSRRGQGTVFSILLPESEHQTS